MVWAIFGGMVGAASKEAGPGAELAITLFGAGAAAWLWLTIFRLKRQQAKRQDGSKE